MQISLNLKTQIISKKVWVHLIIRIVLLLLIPLIIMVYWKLTNDSHRNCTATEHRHVDSGLKMALEMILATFIYWIFLLFEMIKNFNRRKKNFAYANLSILTFLIFMSIFLMIF
jgi:hypothetical protein